ncbi:MAG: flagellar basal body L-ring protein FlgH [Pseudomonadota bacterium]
MRLFNTFITLVSLTGFCLLQSCASIPKIEDEEHYVDYAMVSEQPQAKNGGIYQAGTEVALFEDIKARRVGDIVTVRLIEQNSAQKSADTNLNKSTSISVDPPSIGGETYPEVGIGLGSGNTFSGESGSSQSNSLNASIAVTVRAVLPGGNLLIEGEKWMQINQGKEFIKLRGIVRTRDISQANTILSTQVADAHISYSGTGATEDANAVGWMARVLFSPIWPF